MPIPLYRKTKSYIFNSIITLYKTDMKKIIILLSLSFLISNSTFSQTINDLFDSKSEVKITWLGIDYSHVRLIGGFSQFNGSGENTAEDIQNKYFPAWNLFVFREADKYNIKKMLRKREVDINIDMVKELNEKADASEFNAHNAPNYSDEDIREFVNEYKLSNIKGLGVIFIAEYLNKDKAKALYHYIVINNATNEILLHEKLIESAGGFGVRNFWARSFYSAIKRIGQKYYTYKKIYTQ